jgi:mRNA interferase MazF
VSFDAGDVVIVPFPFTDRDAAKRRPALVLSSAESFGRATGQAVLAMITSARHSNWPLDVPVTDLASAGLPNPCLVRMKLFTLDERLILRTSGRLHATDRQEVSAALGTLLGQDTLPIAGDLA